MASTDSKPALDEATSALLAKLDATIRYVECALTHPSIPAGVHQPLAGDELESRVPVPAVRELYPVVYRLYTETSDAAVFREPVNALAFNIPDYYQIITSPKSLRDVLDAMSSNRYSTRDQVVRELDSIWANAERYNGPKHEFTAQAKRCQEMVRKRLKDIDDGKVVDNAKVQDFISIVEQNGDDDMYNALLDCLRRHAPHLLLEGDEMDLDRLTVGVYERLMAIVQAKTQRPASRQGAPSPNPLGAGPSASTAGKKSAKGKGKGGR